MEFEDRSDDLANRRTAAERREELQELAQEGNDNLVRTFANLSAWAEQLSSEGNFEATQLVLETIDQLFEIGISTAQGE